MHVGAGETKQLLDIHLHMCARMADAIIGHSPTHVGADEKTQLLDMHRRRWACEKRRIYVTFICACELVRKYGVIGHSFAHAGAEEKTQSLDIHQRK